MDKLSAPEIFAIKREIKIQQTLVHPNIVPLIASFERENHLYIFLECLKNSLFQFAKAARFYEQLFLRFFFEISKAVFYLHSKKIVHRDIKPENVLITDHLTVKLCDFGFCANVGSEIRQTKCGTAEYMPPEILRGEDQTDKVDIWCLGILLFELFHKTTPFKSRNFDEMLVKIRKQEIDFDLKIKPEIRNLICKCLVENPSKRVSALQIINNPLFEQFKPMIRSNSSMLFRETNEASRKIGSKQLPTKILTKIAVCLNENLQETIQINKSEPVIDFGQLKYKKMEFHSQIDNRSSPNKSPEVHKPVHLALQRSGSQMVIRDNKPNQNTHNLYYVSETTSNANLKPVTENRTHEPLSHSKLYQKQFRLNEMPRPIPVQMSFMKQQPGIQINRIPVQQNQSNIDIQLIKTNNQPIAPDFKTKSVPNFFDVPDSLSSQIHKNSQVGYYLIQDNSTKRELNSQQVSFTKQNGFIRFPQISNTITSDFFTESKMIPVNNSHLKNVVKSVKMEEPCFIPKVVYQNRKGFPETQDQGRR